MLVMVADAGYPQSCQLPQIEVIDLGYGDIVLVA